MALLAESLVEEWLNRDGYFTIRGVKHGVEEMDLLAVRPHLNGVVGRHVEVQISFRPVTYIAKLTDALAKQFGVNRRSARVRTPEQIQLCAREWVNAKFRARDKAQLRERLWPGVAWTFHLVHAVVKDLRELEVFEAEGVTCLPFHELLSSLSRRSEHSFSSSAGGDLAEIVSYSKTHESG